MYQSRTLIAFTFCVFCICVVQSQSQKDVKALIDTQQSKYYNEKTGLWNAPTGWWNSANALEAIAEYMLYTNDTSYESVIANVYAKTTVPQTLNNFFDDQQWWGLAWLRSYELTGRKEYLDRSVIIWNHVLSNAWDSHFGGGVWWSTDKNYKNAITNELFFTLSSGLYKLVKNTTYLSWAMKEWQWFEQ